MRKFFKNIYSGVVGAAIFLLLGIMIFAFIKIAYFLIKKDLILSKYNIIAIMALFIILGFVYGIRTFHKKKKNFKMLRTTGSGIWINVLVSTVFSIGIYLTLKEGLSFALGWKGFVAVFILLFVLYYAFSTMLASYFNQKKANYRKRRTFFLILLNPVFVLAYLWLFGMVIYNSVYIPCGVSIIGVNQNGYTANTQNLGIMSGEKILTIDKQPIASLNDVRGYISSLDSTKEVVVETEDKLYYIKTYMKGNERFMGLFLKQDYCERKY